MSVAESPIPVLQRGSWPEPIRFRRGWARADARRWNDVVADGALRLVRGGSVFLGLCSERLNDLGAPHVFSPPLPASSRRPWEAAGFEEFVPLSLMRLDLNDNHPSPDHLVIAPPDTSIGGAPPHRPRSIRHVLAVRSPRHVGGDRGDRHGEDPPDSRT